MTPNFSIAKKNFPIHLKNCDAQINHRARVHFCRQSKKIDVKLAYYSKAAEKGHQGALREEYKIGKKLLLDALVETDVKKRMEQFAKGIAAVEKSAEHKCEHNVLDFLKTSLNERKSIENKFNAAVKHVNHLNFDDAIELYWRNLVDNGKISSILA